MMESAIEMLTVVAEDLGIIRDKYLSLSDASAGLSLLRWVEALQREAHDCLLELEPHHPLEMKERILEWDIAFVNMLMLAQKCTSDLDHSTLPSSLSSALSHSSSFHLADHEEANVEISHCELADEEDCVLMSNDTTLEQKEDVFLDAANDVNFDLVDHVEGPQLEIPDQNGTAIGGTITWSLTNIQLDDIQPVTNPDEVRLCETAPAEDNRYIRMRIDGLHVRASATAQYSLNLLSWLPSISDSTQLDITAVASRIFVDTDLQLRPFKVRVAKCDLLLTDLELRLAGSRHLVTHVVEKLVNTFKSYLLPVITKAIIAYITWWLEGITPDYLAGQ